MRTKDYSCKYFGNNQVLNSYLCDVRKYKVLTQDEEHDLIEKYQKEGDIKARDIIIMSNQRFVYSLAKIYAKSEEDVMDYVNEGNEGFIEAIDKFDNSRGFKLITFAVNYIRREMNAYLNSTSNIVVRSNNMKLSKKIDKVKQKYYAEHGISPTNETVVELIREVYGINVSDISDVYDVNITSISQEIDDDFTVEENSEYNEATASVNSYEKEVDREYYRDVIYKLLDTLNDDRLKDIITKLYGIGYDRKYTKEEIGEEYDLSIENVENLENNILKYLRQENKKIKYAA